MDFDFASRRRLLLQAAAMAGAALSPSALGARAYGATRQGDDPFTLGVASGEPEPDGVVLWTRLAPRPLEPDGGMAPRATPVRWEVSEDEGFRRIVRRGAALAGPEAAHAVHVEVNGLRPDRRYWYRFLASGGSSPVGRTRTAPRPSAEIDRLRLIFASCQKYEAGFYAGWRRAVEEDPDLVLFLGDYIYEGAPGSKNSVRLHRNPEPIDLAGYRVRHATYKSDPWLQAAHAAAPWMVIWDDHEVSNDYGGDRDEDHIGGGGDAAAFLRRRAAAYQAYFEHMPLRRRSRPVGPDMLLYRKLDWGRLAQLQFVDDRQFRSARVCLPPGTGRGKLIPDCDARRDPRRTMLGATQERWLLDTLSGSHARWNVLAQQTLFAPLHFPTEAGGSAWSADGWDGAPATRGRITSRWREAQVSNPLVLGGDIHCFAAADVRLEDRGPVVAPSFVGGSITSFGAAHADSAKLLAMNPDLHQHDGLVKGYGRLDLTARGGEAAFRGLADAQREDSAVSTLATYPLEAGRPGVRAA